MASDRTPRKVVPRPRGKKRPILSGEQEARLAKLAEGMRAKVWKPGQSGNPLGAKARGWVPAHIQLREAIRAQKDKGIDPVHEFVEQAVRHARRGNPALMKALMDKMIANKIQIGIGPDDISDVVGAMATIISRHVKDQAVREAIAADIAALDFGEEEDI